MTSNNGSSLEHSSDGTAERAFPALLSSSPGTASDSTTEYMTQMLVAQDDLANDLEQIMEEDWNLGHALLPWGLALCHPNFLRLLLKTLAVQTTTGAPLWVPVNLAAVHILGLSDHYQATHRFST